MNVICITGTPGTGKTKLARILRDELNYPVLDVKKFIKGKKLSVRYDRERKCDVVEVKVLNNEILKEIKKVKEERAPEGIIIDSHLSHYLPKKHVDLCIVTKCDLKELKKRLEKRNYSKGKVRENLDAEIFDICLNEAKEKGHHTFVTDATKRIKKEAISQLLCEVDAIESTSRRTK